MSTKYILGISCFFHDSAAALLKNGEIIAAAQEERFTRIKHDAAFPIQSISFVLNKAEINLSDVSAIVYYEKPFLSFERMIQSYLLYSPHGFQSFAKAIPLWLKEKLFPEKVFLKKLKQHFNIKKIPPVFYSEHHLSHAASAFYPSPYQEALVVTFDGVGEFATTTSFIGSNNMLAPLNEIHFPHSLGLFYSAITGYLGFKVNSGEYKVMGLAPYGNPKYVDLFLKELLHLKDDGGYEINLKYFDYHHGLRMYSDQLEKLLEKKARNAEGLLEQFHMDIAASLQKTVEIAIIHLLKKLSEMTSHRNLCLAGGVALNCVANSKIIQETPFKNVWIQPAAGDAGGALGAALAFFHMHLLEKRVPISPDAQKGSYLGPTYSDQDIRDFLYSRNLPLKLLKTEEIAQELANGKIVGWFEGAMEFGPRALGHRSILGDARIPDMQKRMNLKIKFRESFRPFAPIVLENDAKEIFDFEGKSPYMLFVANVKSKFLHPVSDDHKNLFGINQLNIPRSIFPAITHLDYSARLQTVSEHDHDPIANLLKEFKKISGYGILINTSFNVRGEPIVCSPLDAYKCFVKTDIDILVLDRYYINREDLKLDHSILEFEEFELD